MAFHHSNLLALISALKELKELPSMYQTSVSLFMSFVHTSVNNMSNVYLQNERRYNYTTPKSFLEQISLYSKLLTEKMYDLQAMILRLTDGLVKLESCAIQVLDISFNFNRIKTFGQGKILISPLDFRHALPRSDD